MFLLLYLHFFCVSVITPLLAKYPQIGQTHSDNSWATADKLFERVDHFVGLALKE